MNNVLTALPNRMPSLPCMGASFRRASRALTKLYGKALRPLGLQATQFSVLQALSRAGEVSQGELGEMLAMDSTTLTRTLEIMGRHGWIAKGYGRDRRERRLHLARAGEVQLQRALPRWEKVQARLRRRLGGERWDNLLKLVNEVTTVTVE
ncbi:MAG: MarR family winged helix-turn-helix transcriptional regulator [Terriglobales bacterium]